MNTDQKFYQSIGLLAFATGLLLLIPLVAMQFTDAVAWALGDFFIAGTLIFGTGLTYKLITRKSVQIAYRTAVSLALATAFLLVWVNGAVGIIGSENNPANLMYFAVFTVGIIGTMIARFHPKGMAATLFATAFTQALIPVAALIIWPPQVISWGAADVGGVFVFNAFFVVLFVVSGLLFRYAARKQEEVKSKSSTPFAR